MLIKNYVLALVALTLFATGAFAQSPINAPGAMQPSTGTGVFHEMFMYSESGFDPFRGESGSKEVVALTQIQYGLTHNFSMQFDIPLVHRDIDYITGSDDRDFGIADMELIFKYRLWQNDIKPTETLRTSIIAGLQMPGGTRAFDFDNSTDAWDPIIGTVFSLVMGRHGFNASALYEFYTGGGGPEASDSFRYDASYLYRIAPLEYTMESAGAWYGVLELNSTYDLNGDHEMFLSPGVMYESRTYTIDATVMIPVYQDVNWRGEREFVLGIGARLSF